MLKNSSSWAMMVLVDLYSKLRISNGVEGIFEWIVDPNSLNGVTHRLFIKNGIITGKPSIFPSMKK